MKLQTLIKIAQEEGMTELESSDMFNIYIRFFQQRFPEESNEITSYAKEWARRFMSLKPEKYMDSQSQLIHNTICENLEQEKRQSRLQHTIRDMKKGWQEK